jgi:hypothetical protein
MHFEKKKSQLVKFSPPKEKRKKEKKGESNWFPLSTQILEMRIFEELVYGWFFTL